MNKIFEFINNIAENSTNAVMVELVAILKKNMKRFKYILEYATPKTAIKLNDFINSMPDHFLDMACEETFLDRMFENGEVFDGGRVSIVESLEDGEDEIKMTFVFNKFGNLIKLIISSDVMTLTLLHEDKNADLAMFELTSSKVGCYKLVQTLKGCYSLNRAENKHADFENVCSFEPDRLDRKSTETLDMIQHWKNVAKRDNVEI